MAMPYEILLARRNLGRHPWQTAGMIAGLALAVVVMVYIPSTMSSFYDDMIDRAVEQNAAHVTLWPPEKPEGQMVAALRGGPGVVALRDRTYPRRRDLNGYHALAARAAGTPGVVAVAPFVHGDATVSRGRLNLGIRVEGIDPPSYARVVNIDRHFKGGAPELGPNDIAIGFRMAEKLGIHVGEHVHVATGQTQRLMRVRAVFRAGYYEKDLQTAYVSLRAAQGLFGMGNEVSGLAVRCDDLSAARTVTGTLRPSLGLKVRNWMDDNASLLAEIATVNRVTFAINFLIALAASVGIVNVFSIFVLNRQKELAILRAMGGSRGSLQLILLVEAAFIWVFGVLLGFTLAMGVIAYEQAHPYEVSAETYGIATYATQPKPAAFATAALLAAAAMVVAAWWSGRRARRLNPAEVIFGR